MNHDYINKFNLFDQYVLGKLAADEAEQFENHFIDCPACVEQLNISRNFVDDLRGLAVQETLFSRERHAPAPRRWGLEQIMSLRTWAVIGYCCLVAAVVFAFFGVRRRGRLEAELRQAKEDTAAISQKYQQGLETAAASDKQHEIDRQQLAQRVDELENQLNTEKAGNQSSVHRIEAAEVNFPIYALLPVTRGQAPAPIEIAPPASSPRFALSIPVEERSDFTIYRVKIVDHRGATVWQQGGFRPDAYHSLSLSMNSNLLAPGTYDLRVEGLTPPHQWNTVGSYPFRLARRG